MDPVEPSSSSHDLTTTKKKKKKTTTTPTTGGGRRIVKATPKVALTATTTTPAATPVTTTGTTGRGLETEKEERLHGLPKTAQSDQELLEESLDKDKQTRLTKLQHDQKNKRNKAVDERRRGGDGSGSSSSTGPSPRRGSGIVAMANPFSRFLSVFSVEPKFPSHKRRYEPSHSELQDPVGDLEPKRAKMDPDADDDDDSDDNDNDSHRGRYPSSLTKAFSILQDWCRHGHLPVGWPWMAVVAATGLLTVVVMVSSSSSSSSRHSSHHNSPAAHKRLPQQMW